MGDFGPSRLNTPRNSLEDMMSRIFGASMQNMPGMSDLLNTHWGPGEVDPGGNGQGPGTGGNGGDPNNPNDPEDPNYQGWDSAPAPGTAPAPWTGGGWTPSPTGSPGSTGSPGTGADTSGGLGGGSLIQNLISQFSLPSYGGAMGAGLRPEQLQALGLSSQGMSSFNPGASQGIMGILQQLAQGGGAGTDLMRNAAGGVTSGYQGALNRIGTSDPTAQARTVLQSLMGSSGGEMDAQSILRNIATSPNGGPDFSTAFNAMNEARRTGLGKDTRDLREMFSMGGNRFSTDLMNAIGTRQGESEKQMNSDMSQLILNAAPGMANSRISAATGLGSMAGQARGETGNLASIMGQLGLGNAGNQTGALSSAAGLSLQDIMRQLQAGTALNSGANQAASQLPGAQQGLSLLPGQVAGQGMATGEAARGVDDTAITRMIQEFQRTSGAFLPALMSYAGGAPVITSPGIGQQALGAVTGAAAGLGGAK